MKLTPAQNQALIARAAEAMGFPVEGWFADRLHRLCTGFMGLPRDEAERLYRDCGYIPFSGYPLARAGKVSTMTRAEIEAELKSNPYCTKGYQPGDEPEPVTDPELLAMAPYRAAQATVSHHIECGAITSPTPAPVARKGEPFANPAAWAQKKVAERDLARPKSAALQPNLMPTVPDAAGQLSLL